MKERMKTTAILLVLLVVTGLASYKQQLDRKGLIYAQSLDMVALTVDEVDLYLRDMAVYVAYQEKTVQQDAVVYNPENPRKYWNAYTNQHFVRSVAENAIKDMAAHDEIFYQMAMAEDLELDEAEEVYLANAIQDFFMDLSEEQLERLGVPEEELIASLRKIALANKCQSVLAQIENVEYTEYDYTGAAYEALLAEHAIEENEKVWNRISVGNITVNYKKESTAKEDAAKKE